MAVQTVGWAVISLPVTLLEVNTLGHVICTLVIYIMWWYKPKLNQKATKLEGDWG